MAQNPHYMPQPRQNIQIQQNISNIHSMLGNQRMLPGQGNVPFQQQQGACSIPPNPLPPPGEKTIVDEFEMAYQSCIAPLVPSSENYGSQTVSPDKLRTSVEHAIQQFTDAARKVEAYFLCKHATVAQQQPELILQEEIEELEEEINRRNIAISSHANKVKTWQDSLRKLQIAISDPGPPQHNVPGVGQISQGIHADMMQRR